MQAPRRQSSAASAQRTASSSPPPQRVARRGSSWLDACQTGVADAGRRRSVSATTRAQRPGEVEGRHYYFVSHEDFARRRRESLEMQGETDLLGLLDAEMNKLPKMPKPKP